MKNSLKVLSLLAILTASCGRNIHLQGTYLKPETRVIGGYKVPAGSVPYQVSIQNTFGDHVCGASIVNNEWILTAAHCMEWPIKYLIVVTGTNSWRTPGAIYNIAESHVHCEHNKPYYSNDIALLRLSTPIVFNENTQPIKLSTQNTLKNGDKLTLTGWGSIKLWGRFPDDLNKVELTYLDNDACQSLVQKSGTLHSGHICSSTQAGEGSCQGDSGGPLVDTNGYQVGIVNWGVPCAVGYPDVYASVAYYHDWITNIIEGKSKAC